MQKNNCIRVIILTAAAAVLMSCSPSMFLPKPAPSSAPEVIRLENTGTFTWTIDPSDEGRDVYFVFTNASDVKGITDVPSVKSEIKVDGKTLARTKGRDIFSGNIPASSLLEKRIQEARMNPLLVPGKGSRTAPMAPAVHKDIIGSDHEEFGAFNINNNLMTLPTTRRFTSPEEGIPTAQGNRWLNIYVADDCWTGAGSGKSAYVDGTMVTELATRFLQTGLDNDIYDWVTDILGPEWGSHPYTNLIAPDNNITILLCDLNENDGTAPTGGMLGYFDPTNQYTALYYDDSNQRVMFVIDAVMFATPTDGSWNPSDFWPDLLISTLAHEFQHMVYFYQKNIRNSASEETPWLNEMCSLVMEDLLADKMKSVGPRNVSFTEGTAGDPGNTEGRIPIFNRYTWRGFAVSWPEFYSDPATVPYSMAYTFGAWLARNYGGAKLIRDIVCSPGVEADAIMNAVAANGGPSTMEEIIARWAVSVLGSNRTDMPAGYRYNTSGWFRSTVTNGNFTDVYNLGSINLYNYYAYGTTNPGPFVFSSSFTLDSRVSELPALSNIYYRAAENLTRQRTFTLTVPDGVFVSAYLKPSD